ncbi:AAA family ATPase [Methylophilus luteus]|uniref:AAA family ATPase n=1 Tax=Methylophilus luteus TaxID=640108 RepID=A0ABW3FAL8_9PROT
MSEKTVNLVNKDLLVKFVHSLDKKGSEFQSRFAEVLLNLWHPERPLRSITTDIDFELLKIAFPQFKEVITYYQIQVIVSKKLKRPFQACPVLLLGEAGLGKTYFASELAKLLALPYFEFSLATATANFALSGSDTQWGDGRPGFIIKSIAESPVANPFILIDELDKAGKGLRYDPITPFYSLLEPHSARRFRDESIPLDVDVRNVIWIATANEYEMIHGPILSRFKQFVIKQPTPQEMLGVIDSIYSTLRSHSDLGELIAPVLNSECKNQLVNLSPREVRLALDEAIMSALFNDRSELISSDLPRVEKEQRRVGFL